jgi:Leucine-rich repeat (LRR) protein
VYLVWLKMAECGVRALTNVTWPNLQHLDLSDNLLTTVDMDVFLGLRNLKVLVLARNPVSTLAGGAVDDVEACAHKSLWSVNLSGKLPCT